MSGTVLLVSQPGDAGVAHVVANHVEWASGNGWDPVVACDPTSRLAELVSDRGARLEPWTAVRSPTNGVRSEMHALDKIIERTAPDLVHLHSSKAGLVGRLLVRGKRPTVFQPHAWSFQASHGLSKVMAVRWERFAQRWTDVTVCVSQAEQSAGIQTGLTGQTVLLPNAVDSDRFRPPAQVSERTALREQLGVAPDVPLAVCVGRLCEQKGQDLLLAAWPKVLEAVPSACLALVGDGPDRERLEAQRTTNTIFVGGVTDPVPWFQVADVMVIPSRWEGQALVVLEAMAAAVPVVASDIEPNVEGLAPNAGAVVPADRPDSLAAAIIERLSAGDLARRSEGLNGRNHVQQFHDAGQLASQLTGIWQAVLDSDGVAPLRTLR